MKTMSANVGLLLVLYVFEATTFGVFILLPVTLTPVFLAGVIFPLILFATPFVVYQDANRINQKKGVRTLKALRWALLSLLLWFIAIPWYILIERRKAVEGEESDIFSK